MNAGRLLELTVGDLALIDRLRLTLGPGLNVITGETGAGKSLLIDALGLVRGSRADTSLVRHGAEAARVEALFDRLPEPLIAVREVATNGRSTARLDDIATTASRLADEVGPLVEIHGQHDQQRLLDERWQRDLLDAYGGHGAARAATADVVERWRANRAALAELVDRPARAGAARRPPRARGGRDRRGQAPRPGEADEIRARLSAAQHGEAIARGAAAVREALTADGAGARDAAAMAVREIRVAWPASTRGSRPLAERLAGLEAELEDVAAEVRGLADGIEHDPATLASLEERLGTIYALERRYGDGEAEVIAHGERAVAELERLRGLDGERARREREDAALLAAVATAAGALSEARRTAGTALAGAGRPGAGRARVSRPASSRSRSAAVRRATTSPRSSSTATRSRSTPPASTRSSTASPRTPASRHGRSPGSPPAGSCRASRWPSRASWPRPTRRRSSSSTRSTPGSAAAAPTRSGAACGRWRAATRSCA